MYYKRCSTMMTESFFTGMEWNENIAKKIVSFIDTGGQSLTIKEHFVKVWIPVILLLHLLVTEVVESQSLVDADEYDIKSGADVPKNCSY